MRVLIAIFVTASLLIFSFTSFAATQQSIQGRSENSQSDLLQLKHDIKTVASDIEIIRRDQINFRVEKDILKEAYSSNLQSINIILTILLGAGGLIAWILGYLGLNSIKAVKADYVKELDELKEIKAKFEMELENSKNKQKELEEKFARNQQEFENKIGTLTNTNETQNLRLKVLEIIEKVSGYMQTKQWKWALEHIAVGLDIDCDNILLLSQKSTCHGKLGEFSQAIETYKRIIELEPWPKSEPHILNMLEYLAVSNQQDEFAKMYALYKDAIDQHRSGNLIIYLNILLNLIKGDLEKAIEASKAFANKFQSDDLKKFLGETWSFEEVLLVASRLPTGKQKELLEKTVQLFNGQISTNALMAYLEAS